MTRDDVSGALSGVIGAIHIEADKIVADIDCFDASDPATAAAIVAAQRIADFRLSGSELAALYDVEIAMRAEIAKKKLELGLPLLIMRWRAYGSALGPEPASHEAAACEYKEAEDIIFSAETRRARLSGLRIFKARGEQLAEIPPRTWFIDGMVTLGMDILTARKGMGKSLAAIQAGAAIASGGTFLNRGTTKARVLYVALELDRLAIHERLARMNPLPDDGMDFVYNWPRGDEALDLLEASVTEGGYRVVIIDMLAGILPPNAETNSYDLSPFLSRLRHIGLDHGAAIIALHHSIKGDTGDAVSNMMGTTAFGGQADSIIAIDRKRGESGAKITVAGNHGRDLTLRVQLDTSSCRWVPLGEAEDEGPRLTEADAILVNVLEKHLEGLSASTLAATIGKAPNAARAGLSRLAQRGLVIKEGASWRYTPQAHEAHESAQSIQGALGLCDAQSARTAPPP
jgi:hypothetical protein